MSKAKLRRLKLIEYLHNELQAKSYREVAKKFNTNRRSIYEDLNYLRGKFPDMVIQTDSDTVYLRLPDNIRIDYFYTYMIRESVAFDLLQSLFLYNEFERSEIIKKIDISQSTLYRLVHQINMELLEQYNLEIKLTPVKLVGEEANIRTFYNQLFSEAGNVMDWPFEIVLYKLEEFLQLIAQIFDFKLNFGNKHYWANIIAVNIVRTKLGNKLPNSDKANYYYQMFDTPEHASFKSLFQQATGFEFSKDSLQQLFYPFVQENYIASLSHFISNDMSQDNERKSILYLNAIIDDFIQEFDVILTNRDTLLFELHDTLLINKKITVNTIHVNRKGNFIKYLKKSFPEAYHYINERMTNFYLNFHTDNNQSVVDQFVYTFFIKFNNILEQLQNKKAKLKATIVTDLEYEHALFVYNWIKQRVGPILELDIYEESSICIERLKSLDSHILISNFYIEDIPDKLLLWIEDYPTPQNYQSLTKMISQLDY